MRTTRRLSLSSTSTIFEESDVGELSSPELSRDAATVPNSATTVDTLGDLDSSTNFKSTAWRSVAQSSRGRQAISGRSEEPEHHDGSSVEEIEDVEVTNSDAEDQEHDAPTWDAIDDLLYLVDGMRNELEVMQVEAAESAALVRLLNKEVARIDNEAEETEALKREKAQEEVVETADEGVDDETFIAESPCTSELAEEQEASHGSDGLIHQVDEAETGEITIGLAGWTMAGGSTTPSISRSEQRKTRYRESEDVSEDPERWYRFAM